MAGLIDNLWYNIGPIIVLWVLGMAAMWAIKFFILRNAKINLNPEGFMKMQKAADKYAKTAYMLISIVAVGGVVLCLVFMSNPFENKNAKTITPSEVNESFHPQTNKEISESNNKALTKKSDKMRKEATEQNTEAMDNAMKYFDKVEKSVK